MDGYIIGRCREIGIMCFRVTLNICTGMRDTIIIFYISTKFINIFVFMLVVAPGIESVPADICHEFSCFYPFLSES